MICMDPEKWRDKERKYYFSNKRQETRGQVSVFKVHILTGFKLWLSEDGLTRPILGFSPFCQE